MWKGFGLMNRKVHFILLEMIVVVFFILLSAVLLNPDLETGLHASTVSESNSYFFLSSSSQPESSEKPPESSSQDTSPAPNISDWKLILANDRHPLEAEYIDSIKTKEFPNGLSVDERIYEPLERMLNDAEQLGYHLVVCSAYRSYDKQVDLFNNRVQRYREQGDTQEQAYNKAKTSVALPGASEHHTGLAVDIVADGYQNLDDSMMSRPEIEWLYAHCQDYGFIVRYPDGKSDITGIIHEPWHYRYVGVENARKIMSQGICLEEYLGMVS